MEHITYFVYLLTFANGKIYVGMSKSDKNGSFTTRYRGHAQSAKNGKNLPIYNAWRKYGDPAQMIISKHATREECAEYEINEISEREATNPNIGYNLMRGGEGMHAPKGSYMYALMREKVWDNPSVREKQRIAHKGKIPSPQCLKAAVEARGEEWREKMREKTWGNPQFQAAASIRTKHQMANGGAENIAKIRRQQGDTMTKDSRARQSEKMREFMNSQKGKEIARKGRAAMAANPENIAKFEAGRSAWRTSDANKEHCKIMAKKSAEACSRPVRDENTGIVYSSQRAMAQSLSISDAAVSKRVSSGKVTRV